MSSSFTSGESLLRAIMLDAVNPDTLKVAASQFDDPRLSGVRGDFESPSVFKTISRYVDQGYAIALYGDIHGKVLGLGTYQVTIDVVPKPSNLSAHHFESLSVPTGATKPVKTNDPRWDVMGRIVRDFYSENFEFADRL